MTLFLLFFVFLFLSAFFSSAETAITRFDRNRLEFLRKKGDKKASLLSKIIDDEEIFFATILVGNTLVNSALASISTYFFAYFLEAGENSVLYSTIIITVVILLFSEITPKTVAVKFPERISFLYSYPVAFFIRIFYPISKVLTFISRFFVRLIGKKESTEKKPILDETQLFEWLKSKKIIVSSEEKKDLYHRFFTFFEKRAKDIMLPRNKVISISIELSHSKIFKLLKKHKFSRYPVYKKNEDNIIGVLISKCFMEHYAESKKFDIKKCIRKPLYLPESVFAVNILIAFKDVKSHLGIVVDEFGSYVGIITLEDLIEELTGDILDEKDEEERGIKMVSQNEWIITGDTPISDLIHEIEGLEIPSDYTFSSVAGFVLEKSEELPVKGFKFKHNGFLFEVFEVEKNRIKKVKITKEDESISNK